MFDELVMFTASVNSPCATTFVKLAQSSNYDKELFKEAYQQCFWQSADNQQSRANRCWTGL
jgi:hypothetical protein